MPRLARTLPALTVAAALAASTAVAGAADAAPAVPHGRSAVTFTSTKSHHVKAPAHTRPGIAHLRYTGKDEVIVVEAKHPARASASQVVDGLNRNSPKPLLKNYRLIAALTPKSSLYTKLSPGSYYLADAFANKIKASDVASMTVTGKRVDARVPKSHPVRITPHRDLTVPNSLPKSGWLHLSNNSSSLADLFLVAVSPKATNAQLRDLVAHPTAKKLEKVEDFSRGFGGFFLSGPHSSSWLHYRSPAGRYVAELDAFTGKQSHLRHGQVRVLTLK